ncbi:hypothetical protein AUG19_06260 [archaeon 13_1_20CM_2_54_9]|nr:MAG: hypothetical protein AUG19_06260 [archaeon 13_1_20CM_2_54_9]
MERLGTGCSNLDRLLRGGFPLNQISLVYGEASTGKTVLCMQCAVDSAFRKLKVFYVDSDQSFSPQRLESMLVSHEVAERIVVFRPEDFRDQVNITESLDGLLTRTPSLLVLDSVTGLYRAGLGGRRDVFAQNRELNRELASLASLAKRYPLAVLLTGEVHGHPKMGDWSVEPVATRALQHWSEVILRLRRTVRLEVREAVLEKMDGRETVGPKALFRVTETGIEDS